MRAEAAVVLRAEGLSRRYAASQAASRQEGSSAVVEVFRDLSLEIRAGEMVAVVGESGAGKSSLLHLLAALDRPDAGRLRCGEIEVTGLGPREAAAYRNRTVGYVWQAHYLLPEFTAVENVALPLLARGERSAVALKTAAGWLERVGLGDRADHRGGELSGGEQQRVSIARALVTGPRVLLADEPTGNLDETTAEHVFRLLEQLHREERLASVLVTHNLRFAARCDRVLRLREGRLEAV